VKRYGRMRVPEAADVSAIARTAWMKVVARYGVVPVKVYRHGISFLQAVDGTTACVCAANTISCWS
jgi:hypothetical protein